MTHPPDVVIGRERVLFSAQDEGHMRKTGQPDAVDDKLGAQSQTGERQEATFQDQQMSETTSPILLGVAPISCCSRRMSRVGPAMREVPVSTIAWQPLGQKESTPCTATLHAEDASLPSSGCSGYSTWLSFPTGGPGTHLSILICQ